jgi:hypothetical protein
MKTLIVTVVYGCGLGTVFAESLVTWFDIGSFAYFLAWVGGAVVSLVPVVRTVLLCICLTSVMKWWLAVPAGCVIGFILWLLSGAAMKADKRKIGTSR